MFGEMEPLTSRTSQELREDRLAIDGDGQPES
jgi:hypothetical protein